MCHVAGPYANLDIFFYTPVLQYSNDDTYLLHKLRNYKFQHKHDTNHSCQFSMWLFIKLLFGTKNKVSSIATGKPTCVPVSLEVCVGDCNLCRWLLYLQAGTSAPLTAYRNTSLPPPAPSKAHTHANTPKHRCRGNTVHGSVYYLTHVLRSRLIFEQTEVDRESGHTQSTMSR